MSTITLVGTPDGEPCPHKWSWVDNYDLWYCPLCRRVESDDDDPGDDDGPVAA